MKQYEEIVQNARKSKLDERFANSSIEHARILTNEILLDTNHNVKILSDSFNEYFYSKLLNPIENYLNRDKRNKFEVITSIDKSNNIILNTLKESFDAQVELKFIENNKFPTDKDSKEKVNYIVNDNNAYRYEYSDKNLEYGSVNAVANFNNESESKYLISIFDKIKNS